MHMLLIAHQLHSEYKHGWKMLQQLETDLRLLRIVQQIDLHMRLHRYLVSNQYLSCIQKKCSSLPHAIEGFNGDNKQIIGPVTCGAIWSELDRPYTAQSMAWRVSNNVKRNHVMSSILARRNLVI